MKKKEAQNLSIKKWAMIVCGANLADINHEFGHLECSCGYCDKYLLSRSLDPPENQTCTKCPIRPKPEDYNDRSNSGCVQVKHPYRVWYENKTRANAIEVLKLILNS